MIKTKFLCRKMQMVVILPPLIVQRSYRFSAVNAISSDYLSNFKVGLWCWFFCLLCLFVCLFVLRMVLQYGCLTLGHKFLCPLSSVNVQNCWIYFWQNSTFENCLETHTQMENQIPRKALGGEHQVFLQLAFGFLVSSVASSVLAMT